MSLDKIIVQYDAEIKELRKEVESLKKTNLEIESSAKKAGKSYTDMQTQVKGQLTSAFKGLGLAIAAAFSIQRIGAFISSSMQLATQAQEIKAQFDKLNSPTLLYNLRKATEGTLSDLKLMSIALKADKLQIPLQNLGKIMQFAKLRADELGKTTEDLAETIIQGIGTRSTRALVQVGISQKEFGVEVKKTGDYYEALDNIITTTLDNAGEQFDSVADKQDRLRASIENTKVEIGNGLLPVMNDLLVGLDRMIDGFHRIFDIQGTAAAQGFDKFMEIFADGVPAGGFEKNIEDLEQRIVELNDELAITDNFWGRIFLNTHRRELKEQLGLLEGERDALKALKQESEKTTEQTKKLTLSQEDLAKILKDQKDLIDKNKKAITDYTDEMQSLYELLGLIVKSEGLTQVDMAFQELLRTVESSETPIESVGVNVDALADALLKVQEMTVTIKPGLEETTDGAEDLGDEALTAADKWNQFAEQFSQVIHGVNEAFTTGSDYRLSILQDEFDRGIISQKQYDIQSRKIKRDEAIRDKAVGIFDVIINTQRAITAFLAEGNPLLATLAGVQGLVALGTIIATPLPAFKKGKVMINGDGTETSDSILARISKNESIINARSTRKYKGMLEAINEDRVDKYLMNVYFKEKKQTPVGSDADYREFLELKRLGYINKNGFSDVVRAIKDNRQYARF